MSTASSRSSISVSDSEPDSPAPFCRPWKYLENPASEEWDRGPKEIYRYPNLGDFVVLSIDPVASVAHLDAVAKQAAKRVPMRKYIALCLQTHGLPIHTKPTHPFDFLFVRKGRPQPRLSDFDTENSCLAVLPNEASVPGRPTVHPAHPLPWNDCYLDTTYGFPRPCRVTSIGRDYVPVLPIPISEVLRLQEYIQEHLSRLAASRRKHDDQLPQPFDFITLPPLSPSDTLALNTLSTASQAAPPSEATVQEHPDIDAGNDVNAVPDDVSIIGSEDGSQDGRHDERGSESGDEEELDMLLTFESMMNNVGNLRDPVVDVSYDLDVITEIVDPIHFLEDVKCLNIIMDEAAIRLGMQRRQDEAERLSQNTGSHEDAYSQRPTQTLVKAAVKQDTATDARADVPDVRSTTKHSRGLRALLNSTASRVLSRARNLTRKLGFARCKKRSEDKSES